MKTETRIVLVATVLLLSACAAQEETGDEVAVDTVAQSQMPMGNMPGTGGMQDDQAMQRMQDQMEAMMGAGADSMVAMMPMHRQMAANMLAQMNREMEQMNMAGDEAWIATADSVRQDLARMPELSAEEMEAFMPAHHTRMNRLMEMHRSMMGNMRM
jgi:hypothetical protein